MRCIRTARSATDHPANLSQPPTARIRQAFRGQQHLEQKASDPRAKLLLLCNPHNPVGRVWTRDDLFRLGMICKRHGVTVVSDEIHCDLTLPGHTHIPFAAVGPDFLESSVTCTSPSKAFNLAGLQIANIFAADADMRRRIDKALNVHEVCDVNVFAVEGLIAAYTHGEDWLQSVNGYIAHNARLLRTFVAENLPEVGVIEQEATYLAWIDCKALDVPSVDLVRRIRDDARLWVNEGTLYGASGEGFIRLNIACPRMFWPTDLSG